MAISLGIYPIFRQTHILRQFLGYPWVFPPFLGTKSRPWILPPIPGRWFSSSEWAWPATPRCKASRARGRPTWNMSGKPRDCRWRIIGDDMKYWLVVTGTMEFMTFHNIWENNYNSCKLTNITITHHYYFILINMINNHDMKYPLVN